MADLSRLFVAADLTPEVRAGLAHLLDTWAPLGVPGRPVPPENWHITLRFLGESDDVARDRITAALDAGAGGGPVRIEFDSLAAFPKPSKATVLWVGIGSGAGRLSELAAMAEEAAVDAGFQPVDRPFSPHLTLSRIRPHQDLRPMLERPLGGRVGFQLRALTLFRSHLSRGGARYEPLESFPLD